jgi:hypothetical protein
MLNEQERQRIVQLAANLLSDFNDYRAFSTKTQISLPTTMAALFARRVPQSLPSVALEEFFTFALELQLGLPLQGVILQTNLSNREHPKAPSWLFYFPPSTGLHGGFACVGLDTQRILQTAFQNVTRLVNFLCLHEVAHVFLHWDALFAGNLNPHARFAEPKHEAEAWCFCVALVMMHTEHVAREYRGTPPAARVTHDHVWELLADLRI